MSEYMLINRPLHDEQLRVAIVEDENSFHFEVTSGYSFSEITWKFLKLDDMCDSDRDNIFLLLDKDESRWLFNIFTDINENIKQWSYSEIVNLHRKLT